MMPVQYMCHVLVLPVRTCHRGGGAGRAAAAAPGLVLGNYSYEYVIRHPRESVTHGK